MNSHHGLILGRDRETGELIRHAGEAHAMTFAATGKGKTVGPVITNARTYPGQFIAIDVKGEIYAQSVDYRRQFGPVHAIDLSDELVAEDRLNPFDITRRMGKGLETTSRSMAQSIASPPSVSRNHDQFWANHSISLIEAGAIHLLKDVPEDATPWKLHSLYQGDDVVYSTAVRLDCLKKRLNPTSYSAWAAFLSMPDVTRGGVLATVQADLHIFGTELSRRVTETTSFDLDALIEGRPMSIYFIVPPDRIRAFAPLLRLWFSLLMFAITKRKSKPKHATLFMIDEAAQLGRMDSLLMAMTLLRSYSLRVWSIWQSASQLRMYGDDETTLLDNAGIVQVMGLSNMRAARDTADLMGGITADELMALKPDEQALMIDGRKPFVARQVRFYQEKSLWPVSPSSSRSV